MHFICHRDMYSKEYALDPKTETVENFLTLISVDFSMEVEQVAVRYEYKSAWTLDQGPRLLEEMVWTFLHDPFKPESLSNPLPHSIRLEVMDRATAKQLDEAKDILTRLLSIPSQYSSSMGYPLQGNPNLVPSLPPNLAGSIPLTNSGATTRPGTTVPGEGLLSGLSSSPFPYWSEENVEVQRRLYEAIQQQNIEENLRTAFELTPEAFTSVTMLYVKCSIQGVPIKAFVDSGAQQSFMNVKTAEKCHLMRLVDTRMSGMALGVGQQKIVGRIHLVDVQLNEGGVLVPFSFSVLEDQVIDVIFGLDQLRRHQCCIDLKANCLRFSHYADVSIPFLHEHETQEEMKALQAARIPKGEIGEEGEEGKEGSEQHKEAQDDETKRRERGASEKKTPSHISGGVASITPSPPPPSEGNGGIIGEKHPRLPSVVSEPRGLTPPPAAPLSSTVSTSSSSRPTPLPPLSAATTLSKKEGSAVETSAHPRLGAISSSPTAVSSTPSPAPMTLSLEQQKKVQEVYEFTGVGEEEAIIFLNAAEWNVEVAVALIMED